MNSWLVYWMYFHPNPNYNPVNKLGLQSAWCDGLVNTKSKPNLQSPRNEFVWIDGENGICIRTTIAAE